MSKIPKFQTEQEEAEFWDSHDSTGYLEDTEEVDVQFVDARPKTMISLRLQPEVIQQLKALASQKGLGYQTLMRMWIMERLNQEANQAAKKKAVG